MNSLFSNLGVAFSFFLFLYTLATPVHAQAAKSKVFQWKFSDNALGAELPTCGTFGITIQPYNTSVNTTGVPPYYMIGYATNGISRTTLVGKSFDSVSWTVDYPVGTKLALSVVDSEGTSGGIPPQMYTIVSGSSTSCVVNDDKRDFTVRANVTTTINTCEPWGLRITGGVAPYNVTFLQINSPIVTNATMGSNYDAYTYIDRADPNKLLIAAVYDITGRFAYGAPTVMPQGSSIVDCIGLNSAPGKAAELDKQDEEARAAVRRKRTAIIAGTVVPISLVIIAGVAMWYFLWYKPRSNKPKEIDLLDTSVKPYTETGQVLSINAFLNDPASSPGGSPKHPPGLGRSATAGSHVSHSAYGDPDLPFDPYNQSDSTSSTSQRPPSGTSRHSGGGRPGFTNFPVRRPTVKAAEAAMSAQSGDAAAERSGSGSGTPGNPSVTRTTSVGQTNTGEPELIIQHRDGGPGRVTELPPPYADRPTPRP